MFFENKNLPSRGPWLPSPQILFPNYNLVVGVVVVVVFVVVVVGGVDDDGTPSQAHFTEPIRLNT